MENLKILTEFSTIASKLEYFQGEWYKLNQSGSRVVTEQNAMKIIEDISPSFFSKFTLDQLRNELRDYTSEKKKKEQAQRDEQGWGNYEDETQFILDMNKQHKLFKVEASGTLDGKSKLPERLKVLASRYVRDTGDKGIKPANIYDHLEVIVDDMALKRKEELKAKIAFDPNIADPFDDLLDAMRVTDHRELHKRALKHYVWQVKRKLWGHEPTYHFMLVLFTNRQAFGKSVFLRRFHGALDEVFASISGDRIRDQFGAELFENYFVACVDEMARLNSADIHLLKEFVTRKSSVNRKMYSQISRVNKQNTTLCGTTNRPINQIIYDPSGMRRWWQINLNVKDFESMDFEQLEKWHNKEFLKFWKSVDENDEHGFYGKDLPYYKEMLAYQDTFKAVSPAQQFVEDMGYSHEYSKNGNENFPIVEVDMDKVWTQWVAWCKATRNNPYTLQTFRNNLQEIGFETIEHRPINKTTGERNRGLHLKVDRKDNLEGM